MQVKSLLITAKLINEKTGKDERRGVTCEGEVIMWKIREGIDTNLHYSECVKR